MLCSSVLCCSALCCAVLFCAIQIAMCPYDLAVNYLFVSRGSPRVSHFKSYLRKRTALRYAVLIKLVCVQVANYLVDRLGKKCVTAELLQPDELISGMISQVAAEPEMALLLNHFIYSTHGEHSAAVLLLQLLLFCTL